jgi:hypothetical protein
MTPHVFDCVGQIFQPDLNNDIQRHQEALAHKHLVQRTMLDTLIHPLQVQIVGTVAPDGNCVACPANAPTAGPDGDVAKLLGAVDVPI